MYCLPMYSTPREWGAFPRGTKVEHNKQVLTIKFSQPQCCVFQMRRLKSVLGRVSLSNRLPVERCPMCALYKCTKEHVLSMACVVWHPHFRDLRANGNRLITSWPRGMFSLAQRKNTMHCFIELTISKGCLLNTDCCHYKFLVCYNTTRAHCSPRLINVPKARYLYYLDESHLATTDSVFIHLNVPPQLYFIHVTAVGASHMSTLYKLRVCGLWASKSGTLCWSVNLLHCKLQSPFERHLRGQKVNSWVNAFRVLWTCFQRPPPCLLWGVHQLLILKSHCPTQQSLWKRLNCSLLNFALCFKEFPAYPSSFKFITSFWWYKNLTSIRVIMLQGTSKVSNCTIN